MRYSVVLRKKAERQILEAFSWYEEQRKGLGDDFLLCLESALLQLTGFHMAFSILKLPIK
jgi:hypothetical protein